MMMDKLTQLKAEAYDVLATIEQYSNQIELLKAKLAEVNKEISEVYSLQQQPIEPQPEEDAI